MPTVLYVCHNHASVRPGGVETYSLELFDGMRAAGAFEPIFLARARLPDAPAAIMPVPGREGQYFFHVDHAGYDAFFGTVEEKRVLTGDFAGFLRARQPAVVHFQHTLFLGYDLIRQVRSTLPDAAIVYTLHEYLPICHHNGQLVRTRDLAPCAGGSPDACHACFPDISREAFWLRRRFIEAQFRLVDLFIAPSRFLRDRYVEWGIPSEKICVEDYGRQTPSTADAPPAPRTGPRSRFGFFGQLTPFKGIDVLLRAMIRLDGQGVLFVHGANLEFQSKGFQQDVHTLVDRAGRSVSWVGPYEQRDVSRLMASVDWVVVPSIWWENSPLVIQEASMHGRPVICSDIGGMAEKVTAGVNGLHFRAGDDESLADALRQAATTAGLWERLRQGIREVPPMEAHVARLIEAYRSLMAAGRK